MMGRYSSRRLQEIWEEEEKYQIWLDIEIALVEALVLTGVAPEESLQEIKEKAVVDVERIRELEYETKHDVVAFTRQIGEKLSPQTRRWVHYGITSSDVVDTANAILLKRANKEIKKALNKLVCAVADLAVEHKYTLQVGRSHGIHGEPISFGFKLAGWYANIRRDLERFDRVSSAIETGKMSGSMGTYANTDPQVEEYINKKFGLNTLEQTTQIIPRDLYADYVTTVALMATNIERYAVEIRSLQRTEIGEVAEGFSAGQKGSSSMPHKRNPIGAENLTGIARLLRSYAGVAYDNIPLWHERDISHSSTERVMLPEVTSLIEYQIRRLTGLIRNLHVDKERMQGNLKATRGLIHSQQALHALIDKGLSREEAYDIIQPMTQEVLGSDRENFKNSLRRHPLTKELLTPKEINEICDPEKHLKHIDLVFDRLGLSALM